MHWEDPEGSGREKGGRGDRDGEYIVLPAPLVEQTVFFPLYVFASFVKAKVSLGAWIYLWTFYILPLVYISVCASTIMS